MSDGTYFVSVPEFGRRFGLGRSTAYRLTSDGTIRTVAVGARRLVPVNEMDRYAAELLQAAGIDQEGHHAA